MNNEPTADQSKNAKAEKMKEKIRTAYMEYRLLKGNSLGASLRSVRS